MEKTLQKKGVVMGGSGRAMRNSILGQIRSALGVNENDRAREIIVQKKLRGRARNLIPSRASLPAEARRSLFQTMLEAQSASVAHIDDAGALPEAIAHYLDSHNLGKTIRTGDDTLWDGYNWEASLIKRKHGIAMADDQVALSHAAAGASETGTLFLLSGLANPTTLNYLPETHIIVVRERDISGSYEAAWQRIRQITDADRQGASALPRTVNLISGPSRTADIEQTIILGAHGPRRLHVIVIGDG